VDGTASIEVIRITRMTLEIQLDPIEARVLGVMVEKDLTTPDQYPLTLNSLTLGANQKSNRDPVLDLMEGDVYAALQKLIRKGLAGSVHPVGSRVEKFRHNGESMLKIETGQLAILAELLMRGPQQPGELRSRASRMTAIESLPALIEMLKPMMEMGLVVRLDPSPGSRAERYAQRLAPNAHPIEAPATTRASAEVKALVAEALAPPTSAAAKSEELEKRVVDLESNVARLRRQLDHLAWRLGEKLEG
jgi:uncharacterized protein YceH (UPF0502 family)